MHSARYLLAHNLHVHVPLFLEVHAVSILGDPFAMLLPILKPANVFSVVRTVQSSLAAHHIILEITHIPVSLDEIEFSETLLLVVDPKS